MLITIGLADLYGGCACAYNRHSIMSRGSYNEIIMRILVSCLGELLVDTFIYSLVFFLLSCVVNMPHEWWLVVVFL